MTRVELDEVLRKAGLFCAFDMLRTGRPQRTTMVSATQRIFQGLNCFRSHSFAPAQLNRRFRQDGLRVWDAAGGVTYAPGYPKLTVLGKPVFSHGRGVRVAAALSGLIGSFQTPLSRFAPTGIRQNGQSRGRLFRTVRCGVLGIGADGKDSALPMSTRCGTVSTNFFSTM